MINCVKLRFDSVRGGFRVSLRGVCGGFDYSGFCGVA